MTKHSTAHASGTFSDKQEMVLSSSFHFSHICYSTIYLHLLLGDQAPNPQIILDSSKYLTGWVSFSGSGHLNCFLTICPCTSTLVALSPTHQNIPAIPSLRSAIACSQSSKPCQDNFLKQEAGSVTLLFPVIHSFRKSLKSVFQNMKLHFSSFSPLPMNVRQPIQALTGNFSHTACASTRGLPETWADVVLPGL